MFGFGSKANETKLGHRIAELERELTRVKDSNKRLEKDKESLAEANTKLRRDNAAYQIEVTNLRESLAGHEAVLSDVEDIVDQLKMRINGDDETNVRECDEAATEGLEY